MPRKKSPVTPVQPEGPLDPIAIELPEGVPLEGGATFVRLRTQDELESFWSANRERYPFAVEGFGSGLLDGNPCLDNKDWIFGPTKAAVVKAMLRWAARGMRCEWYDWATKEPDAHKGLHAYHAAVRREYTAKGEWTEKDEREFNARTPEKYTGWWSISPMPRGDELRDWVGSNAEELWDRTMAPEEAERLLLEQVFEACSDGGWEVGLFFYAPPYLDDTIVNRRMDGSYDLED
jgi:hypothetical protein